MVNIPSLPHDVTTCHVMSNLFIKSAIAVLSTDRTDTTKYHCSYYIHKKFALN